MRAKAIAVLGTASDVGKSVVAAGLCRLLARRGIRVAPFKAQNMSLNSFVTPEGGEIGRAQALQAKACGLEPHVDMNPILLKPESDRCSQIIVRGKVWGRRDAREYFSHHEELTRVVRESYERLAGNYEAIVIEGAGSAAEMNLKDRDLVNWPVVEFADARVVLVADIDRGGVFAQVVGTLDLLSAGERPRVLGVVINKFRGDATLFEDGRTWLESRTGVPILGVLPFLRDLELDQEDSLDIKTDRQAPFRPDGVNVAVVLLSRMSNFTDFNSLSAEPDVTLRYASSPEDLAGADVVILPGSKNTLKDLRYLKLSGFPGTLEKHLTEGGELVGICGGYQMLGLEVSDPQGLEAGGRMDGLGFLGVKTELSAHKRTEQVEARPLHMEAGPRSERFAVSGYEIHVGETEILSASPCFRIRDQNGAERDDGAFRKDSRVWGTYIHGLFDRPGFRRLWLNQTRRRKDLQPLEDSVSEATTRRLHGAIDRWADHFQRHLDLARVFEPLDC